MVVSQTHYAYPYSLTFSPYIIDLEHHHLTVPISYNFFSHDSFLNDVILDISTISVEEHGIKLKN